MCIRDRDEPNTYIDKRFEAKLYSLLEEINKERAIILVSHDIGTVLQKMCIRDRPNTMDMALPKIGMAFFAFIPILGSAISIVLGMMRANIWIAFQKTKH